MLSDVLTTLVNLLILLVQGAVIFYFIRWMRRKSGRLENIGSWSRLEKHFVTPSIPESYTYTSGLIGWGRYEDTLKLAYHEEGVYLDVPAIFRFGSKPLFIPYSEFIVSEKNPTLWHQFRTYTQFTVRGQSVCIAQDEACKILARRQALNA